MPATSFDLDRTIALLERTPATLAALLDGLPDEWTRANEGPETFSPYDVVGHLIHGEKTDWMVRARIILDHGEARPFDRYDRLAQFRDSAGKSLRALPPLALTVAGWFVPLVRELNEMAYQWQEPFLVDDRRYRERFGGDATPLEQGARATVEWALRHYARGG